MRLCVASVFYVREAGYGDSTGNGKDAEADEHNRPEQCSKQA
jgi:hypothetical protein